MSNPLPDDMPPIQDLAKELAELKKTWMRVKFHRNDEHGQPIGKKKIVKDRIDEIEAALGIQDGSVGIAGGAASQSVATAASVTSAQPAAIQPTTPCVVAQPATAQLGVDAQSVGPGIITQNPAHCVSVTSEPTGSPPDAAAQPSIAMLAVLNVLATTQGVVNEAQMAIDEEDGISEAQKVNMTSGTNSATSANIVVGSNSTTSDNTVGKYDNTSLAQVSSDAMDVENDNTESSSKGDTELLELEHGAVKDVSNDMEVENKGAVPSSSETAENIEGVKLGAGPHMPMNLDNTEGTKIDSGSSIPLASHDTSNRMDTEEEPSVVTPSNDFPNDLDTNNNVSTPSDGIKEEDNAEESQSSSLDSLIKDLVMSSPHYGFILPGTAEELLAYKFTYDVVDWDDVPHLDLEKKDDEDKNDFMIRRRFYMRAYELEYTEKRKELLDQLRAAIKDECDAGRIESQEGADKLKSLDPEVLAMDSRLKRMRKELTVAQGEYGRLVEVKKRILEEKRLRAEVEFLNKELRTVNDLELPALRKKIVSAIEALEETVAKIQETKKKRKRREGEEEEDTRYYRLDDEGRDDFLGKARKEIAAVLHATTEEKRKKALNKIDVSVRRAARDVQQFLPEASYTTKEIALIIHFTSSKNFLCRYHQRNRGHHQFDNVIELTGIAFPKDLSSPQKGRVVPPPGHMNCGCAIDDALLEFFFWKTIRSFSTHPRLAAAVRYLTDNEVIPAKFRRYWVEHWKEVTCLTINDIYGGDATEPGWIPRLAALSAVRQIAKLNSLGYSITISHTTEESAQNFSKLLRQGEDMRVGVAEIEIVTEPPAITRWEVSEVDPSKKNQATFTQIAI